MSQTHTQTTGIVIKGGRFYDLVAGPLIRTTDAAILARAAVTTGDHVLDVGTGPGYLAIAASKLVGSDGLAIGIDASPGMIDRARTLAARTRSAATYEVASAESLPFDDDVFDVAVSRLVFHHLTGDLKERALAEIARVLKPNGRLLVADLASSAAKHSHRAIAHLLGNHPETEADLEDLIRGSGFTELTTSKLAHGLLVGVAARNPERGTPR